VRRVLVEGHSYSLLTGQPVQLGYLVTQSEAMDLLAEHEREGVPLADADAVSLDYVGQSDVAGSAAMSRW
jgi:hypothetical protein